MCITRLINTTHPSNSKINTKYSALLNPILVDLEIVPTVSKKNLEVVYEPGNANMMFQTQQQPLFDNILRFRVQKFIFLVIFVDVFYVEQQHVCL